MAGEKIHFRERMYFVDTLHCWEPIRLQGSSVTSTWFYQIKGMLQKKCYKKNVTKFQHTCLGLLLTIQKWELWCQGFRWEMEKQMNCPWYHTQRQGICPHYSLDVPTKKKTISTLQYGNENSDGSKYRGWKMPVCVLKVQISTI